MNKFIMILASLMLSACATTSEFAKYKLPVDDGITKEYIVFKKSEAIRTKGMVTLSASTIDAMATALGATSYEPLPYSNGFLIRTKKNVKEFSIDKGSDWVVQENLKTYHIMQSPVVITPYTCPANPTCPVCPGPIDPGPGTPGSDFTWGQKAIRAAAAQALVNVKSIIVCDSDTGLDSSVHNMFAPGSILGGQSFVGETWSVDGNGHGTHTAGTIASLKYGVAPGVKLVIAQVLNKSGSGSSQALGSGIAYCVNSGAKYINASWGMDVGTDAFIGAAIDQAVAKGVMFVAAAGNSSGPIGFPGSKANVRTATAMTEQGGLAGFSSRGTKAGGDMYLMPGTNVISTWPLPLGGPTRSLQGTSMACPHLVGVSVLAGAKGRVQLGVVNKGLPPDQQGKGMADALLSVQ